MTDGTVISGRKAYNDYCKEHKVTNPADFKEEWAKKAIERAEVFNGGNRRISERRREELARNYKEFKSYGEYQRHLEKIGRK